MEIISQQACINEQSSHISSLEQDLKDKIHEVNVLNHSLSAKDKLFMNVIKDRDRFRDEIQNLKSSRQAVVRQQKQNQQLSEENESNSHHVSFIKPSDQLTVMSIGIQCDGVHYNHFDYYNDDDNEEEDSNPWNVRFFLLYSKNNHIVTTFTTTLM